MLDSNSDSFLTNSHFILQNRTKIAMMRIQTQTMLFLIIIIILAILLFLYSMIWPPDSPWSPWWQTPKSAAVIMTNLAEITETDIIYDLGSGDGTALITAAKLKGARGVGVEIDLSRVLISRLAIKLNRVERKIKIVRKNFFDVDISEATVVFMYLVPKAIEKLKPKLLQELKPGTRIVTFVYKTDFPLIAEDKKNEVYVYEIPKKAAKKN
jgi:SAM-dependent methyltransferase